MRWTIRTQKGVTAAPRTYGRFTLLLAFLTLFFPGAGAMGQTDQSHSRPEDDPAGDPEALGIPDPSPGDVDIPAPQPGTLLSDRVVHYRINATLDPRLRTIRGEQTLQWTNKSPEPVSELRFHLYWNAFKNQRTTYFRGLEGGSFRFESRPFEQTDWGYIDVTSIQISGEELVDLMSFLQPNDHNPDDQSVMVIPLPAPANPGDTVEVAITFRAKAPRVIARTGFYEDFFFVGQWFPKIGVLEYSGIRRAATVAWNCHQFHAHSEFYADFGSYDVSLTVPSAYVVGATGVLAEESSTEPGTKTYRYTAEDVHDFAWTAWPGYQVREETFESPNLDPVKLRVLYPKEKHRSVGPALEALKGALDHAARVFFPYPYPELTLVIVPYNAKEAGGMEYPTLITTWAPIHPGDSPYDMVNTVVHEFMHQYWYGMLASNEFEESWLDEGITTYTTAVILDALGKKVKLAVRPFMDRPIPTGLVLDSAFDFIRFSLQMKPRSPVASAVWEFASGTDYSLGSYGKPAITLRALEATVGSDVMSQVMRTYARRWAFRHPHTDDFIQAAEEVSRQDLHWFFSQFVKGIQEVDYAVTRLKSESIGAEQGFFDGPEKRRFVGKEAVDAQREAWAEARESTKSGSGASQPAPTGEMFRTSVLVERLEDGVIPQTLRVQFEDESTAVEHWDGTARWKRFEYDRPSQAVRAMLITEGPALLDKDRLNNGRVREKDQTPGVRLGLVLVNLHQALSTLLFF